MPYLKGRAGRAAPLDFRMDLATGSLQRVLDGVKSGEYVLFPGVPLFDEHDEHGPDGKLLRRFDRQKLQQIVDTCNRRERNSGDLAPFGPGHTVPNQYDNKGILVRPSKEEEQPPIWGYYRNYRLGNFGPGGKLGIIADCYARKEFADKVAKEFPRRSIELFPAENLIDWIAHLRRSPRRDLGMLAYSQDAYQAGINRWCPWEGAKDPIFSGNRRSLAAAVDRAGKLRYSLEADMPLPEDPTRDPNVDMPDNDSLTPEEERQAERYWKHYMRRNPKMMQFAADAGGAPGGAPPMPGAPQMPGPNGDAPMMPPESYSRLADLPELQQLQRLARERDQAVLRMQRAEIDRDLSELAAAGVEFDEAQEREYLMSLNPQQRTGHLQRMASRYSRAERAPVGGAIVQVAGAADPRYDGASQDIHRKAMHYMREHPGMDYDACVAHVRGT